LDGQDVPLEVVESRDERGRGVGLRGKLDIATGAAVTERRAALRERGESVMLDLDELTFIDRVRTIDDDGKDGDPIAPYNPQLTDRQFIVWFGGTGRADATTTATRNQ
jgi:hypothetical protein